MAAAVVFELVINSKWQAYAKVEYQFELKPADLKRMVPAVVKVGAESVESEREDASASAHQEVSPSQQGDT